MKKYVMLIVFLLLFNFSKASRTQDYYDSLIKYKVYEPKISLSIIMYETGWLNYKKKSAFSIHNNLFGFMWKGTFIHYKNHTESIIAYKKWQDRYWKPYHKKYPKKTYYDFLIYMPYCDKMDEYIKDIKWIYRQLKVS